VHEWFKSYYGPNNAVIAIAGDVNTQAALEKVKKYFGDIPAGPPVVRYEAFTAKRTGSSRQIAQDRVPQARIYKVWNIPAWGTECSDRLDLVSDLLSSGKTSRLYKRLVYEDQIATDVSAYIDTREIAGLFFIVATAKPGESLEKVEKAIDEELAKFIAEGPTENELQRVKAQYMSNFIRGSERIGGFGGKSDILIRNEVFGGSPDYYKTHSSTSLTRLYRTFRTPPNTGSLMVSTILKSTPIQTTRLRRAKSTAPACRFRAQPRRLPFRLFSAPLCPTDSKCFSLNDTDCR